MKKLIITGLLAIIAFTSAPAQNSKFGVKGGLNLSSLNTKDNADANIRIGYHAGLFLKLSLTNYFGIEPELLYSAKGACLEYKNDLVEGQANFNLNYFDVPVLAVINLNKRYTLHFGPYFSMLANANLKNE